MTTKATTFSSNDAATTKMKTTTRQPLVVAKNNNNKRKFNWTNTNSDEQCLQDQNNPISRFLYVLSLKTGIYSIEPTDRRISLIIAGLLFLVSTIMCYVFVQGVKDGIQHASQQAAAAASL